MSFIQMTRPAALAAVFLLLLNACAPQPAPFEGPLVLFDSGENGASTYRIPALAVTNAGTLLAFGATGGILMPALVGFLAQSGGFEMSMIAILVSIVLLTVFSAVNIRMKTRKGVSET